MVRPQDLITPRPDNSNRVSKVEQANSRQIQLRSNLPANQTRLTFQIAPDSRASAYQHVVSPIAPSSEESLYVSELGQQLPYQPASDRNVTFTQVTVSSRSPSRLDAYVDGQLFAPVYLVAGNYQRDQIAGLAEFADLVNDLDGSHTIDLRLRNLSDQTELEAAISIRAIQTPTN